MADIRSLVDTFGPPPREIYLDWAYQIEAFVQAAAAADGPDCSLAPLPQAEELEAHWTSLEVADDGQLRLEGLSVAVARQALAEVRQWAAVDASTCGASTATALTTSNRENHSSTATVRACGTLDQDAADSVPSRSSTIRKRDSKLIPTRLQSKRVRLTAAVAVLATAAVFVIAMALSQVETTVAKVSDSANSNAGSGDLPPIRSNQVRSSTETAAVDDYVTPIAGSDALAGGWTTSAELTDVAPDGLLPPPDPVSDSSQPPALTFSPAPAA